MINYTTLLRIISNYKRDIKSLWKKERYKWVAIKHFQNHWDIEAENFADMIKDAISKTDNLLNSGKKYAGGQIILFATEFPQETRNMFRDLYNEQEPYLKRIKQFKLKSYELFEQHNAAHPTDVNSKTCYQDDNTITIYLWLRFPDKYYIYKYSEYVSVEKTLCDSHNIKKSIGLEPGYTLYNQIRDYLRNDQELLDIWRNLRDKDCYNDYEFITGTVDFGFYISRYCKLIVEPSPRYWVFNHNFPDSSEEDRSGLILNALKYNHAFMQYEYEHQTDSTHLVTQNWAQLIQIREGDYVFLRSENYIYAVGQAIVPRLEPTIEINAQKMISQKRNAPYLSGQYRGVVMFEDADVFYEDFRDGKANNWGQRIDVDAWKYHAPHGICFKKHILSGSNQAAIREIANKQDGEQLIKELKQQLGMKYEILNQLENCRNLILTGAPGTGKTYLAKQIARLLLFGKSDEIELNDAEKEIYKSHVEFVQFHPSYDYSDFVEGLRPFTSDEGSTALGFERKNGVFKEFCKRAILNAEVGNDNFDEAWAAMVADITSQDYIDVQLISGKGMFRVELNEYGTGLANRTYPNNVYEKDQWIVGKSKFFSKDQLKNIYHGRNGVPGGGHDNYRRAIVEHMKQNYGLKEYEQTQIAPKPYIFIIDEINRGELSKILGELFYSIDPGYRGVIGRVKTQYQNLILEDDTFSDGFYVPENVYILGTMNDIDRSVESMDFAIRRRFTWREISAVDTQEEMLQLLDKSIREKAKKSMNALNDAILNPDYHLGAAYQIGASYFLKLQHDPNFDNLWKFHLKGVIYEYLRGQRDIDSKLEEIYNAFIAE